MKVTHFVLTVYLLLNTLAFAINGVSIIGQWIDKLLVWSWLISSMAIIIVYSKERFAKQYLKTLILLFLLSLLPMMIPFISFFNYLSDLNGYPEFKIGFYRVQEVNCSPLGLPTIELIKIKIINLASLKS